ncbi:hypothetical protein pb186bvf_016064 [Paramecium bursaria]
MYDFLGNSNKFEQMLIKGIYSTLNLDVKQYQFRIQQDTSLYKFLPTQLGLLDQISSNFIMLRKSKKKVRNNFLYFLNLEKKLILKL